MLDETDFEIIKIMQNNSRAQLQEIGNTVHLTGQAVRNRITRLEKLGVIEGYTIKTDMSKLGRELIAFITVYMKTNNHSEFLKFIRDNILITEAYRISGDGCYKLKVEAAGNKEIEVILDSILPYGNYRLNLSIGKIK